MTDTGESVVFESLPSGLDIAHWFCEQGHGFQNQGGNSTLLSREPLCWLWYLAFVDHDDQEFYLLDIGTDGVRDLLFVTSGLQGFACEWRNKPTTASTWRDGALTWFEDTIEQYEGGWHTVVIGGSETT